MMEIFWTMLASQDRKRIREYIAEQNLMAAIELDERIGYSASSLAGQPYKGRNGRVEGTRELVILPILFWFMRSIASGEKCISCAYCIPHRSGHKGAVRI
ncbi:TPA: type II toxin-antitoxin system RelE/ParE family toxin [Escherichia coli]|nr:plasmid stabilization protein ParE [Escherichia coli]HAX5303075.1 type II toxin-antitoxin system RelE/ParE family toxin [Escherichia coli]